MSTRVPLLACIAVLAFFAGITGVRLAYTLTYILALLLVVAFVWSRAVARRLRVHRESPSENAVVGQHFVERFRIVNGSSLPIAYCEVNDLGARDGYRPGRVCSLPGGGAVTWSASGRFARRGRHAFGPLEVRLSDPFGLFPRALRLGSGAEVLVYPPIHSLDRVVPAWAASPAGDPRGGGQADVPPDSSSVREYDPGDGLNRIHWMSTAHSGRLMSRTYDTRRNPDLLVVLDLQTGMHVGVAPESSLEYAVSLAASLVHAGIRRGQGVGLVANDAAHTALGAGRGEAQRQRLLDYLALAVDDGDCSLASAISRYGAAWRGRGGIVVVTASRDPAWVEALVATSSRGVRHLCVVVEAASFGAPGPPLRISPAWRLVLDWLVVRRGDVLGVGADARAAGL